MNPHVTSTSQTHRLREQMERSDIRHGATARVDIPRVRVGAGVAGEGQIFFCDVGPIHVRRHVVAGDEAPVPDSVQLQGLEFPGPGEYDVLDTIVSTNGDIRIIADESTQVRVRKPMFTSLF